MKCSAKYCVCTYCQVYFIRRGTVRLDGLDGPDGLGAGAWK